MRIKFGSATKKLQPRLMFSVVQHLGATNFAGPQLSSGMQDTQFLN